jgi:murein DD-endopeptidase MepM/ murein hydrolase activator NlpD
MSLTRPVALSSSGSQGVISQKFDGTFSWEPAGWLRRGAPAMRGKRSKWVNSTAYAHIHLAIDYICAIGTPVRAVKSGIVVWQGKDITGAYVVYLRIRRSAKYDLTFVYYHLKADSFRFGIGQSVKRDATVALSGMTGWATGPHLHAELIRTSRGTPIREIYSKGIRYDPQPFINGTASLRSIAP